MKRRVKSKEHENLSDSNIQRVIDLLANGGTKKEACQLLNIAYNTTRLSKIIEQFEEDRVYRETRKEQNRGKPPRPDEIETIVRSFIDGDPISDIAKRLYRSAGFVNRIIEALGIPTRGTNDEARQNPCILPDACITDVAFEPGEVVWSAKYHAPAQVVEKLGGTYYQETYDAPAYKIYVPKRVENQDNFFPNVEVGGFYAYAVEYDLGSLRHLAKWLFK